MSGAFQERVLLLNRLWQAVNIVGVKRAYRLLFKDRAQVLYHDGDNFYILHSAEWISFSMDHPPRHGEYYVRTINFKIRVPKILLLCDYHRLPIKEVKMTRRHLFERDNYACQYCGQQLPPQQLNLDHVLPRDRGGRTTWENVVTSCIPCNAHKANRLPHEAGMRLKHKPIRPKRRPFVSFASHEKVDDSWKHFL